MEEGEYKSKVQIKLKNSHKHHTHHHKSHDNLSYNISRENSNNTNERGHHEKKYLGKKINREEKENENNKNEKSKLNYITNEKKYEKISELKNEKKLLENITLNENFNIQLESNDNINKLNNPNDKIYSHITKNDKMKVLFKIDLNKEELINNFTYEVKKKFKSIREDIWNIKFIHEFYGENKGGKIKINILLEKQNEEKKEIQTLLSQIFESIFFNIELSLNFLSFKVHNTELQNITYNKKFSTSEILIPPEVYSDIKNINKNFNIILEMLISKNFFDLQKMQLNPFNGIYNEGATCYMNSMLQTLFSIYPFKKAVFQIPTEKENSRSIVLSLQRLFYDLIYNHSPASTKNLINSFGWSQEQIQIQHDVQEFNVLLSEVMEEKMKKTPVEGTFSRLFEGKYLNYIKCINIDFHSEKMEKFYDLQLTIKGYKDIYQSLDDYIKEEILDNDNKYDTEKYGKQKAKKRIKFIKFPPVLILQLKRIEYNSRKEIMVKINDHYEYYDEINLSKYIEKNISNNVNDNNNNINNNSNDNNNKEELNVNLEKEKINDNIYTLHSVVVHQGNATSGHYYAYIKPSTNKKEWLLFNDDIVKPADPYEIFQQNFGGNIEVYKNKGGKEIITNSINYERSAYILVYVRKNIQNELIGFDNIDIVPSSLKKRFESEKEEEKSNINKKKSFMEDKNIFLISNQNVFNHVNKLGIVNSFIDLNNDLPLCYNTNSRMIINFPLNLTFFDFLEFIESHTNIQKNNFILYDYLGCEDIKIFSRQDYDLKLIEDLNMKISDYRINNKKTFLTLFLYVKNNYILFNNNGSLKDFCEEIEKENSQDEKNNSNIIYIFRNMNKFMFKMNTTKNNSIKEEEENNKNIRIIFVKKYEQSTKTLSIEKIFHLNITKKNNLYENLIQKLQNQPVGILIEKTSPINQSIKNSSNAYFLDEKNIFSILENSTSLIIIPIYSSNLINETINYISSLNSIIYIDVYSHQINGNFNYEELNRVIKKLRIELKQNQDEKNLKELILKQLKEKHTLPLFFKTSNHYFINSNSQMESISEDFLKSIITIENIDIYDDYDIPMRQINDFKEYPILNSINFYECLCKIKISLFKQSDLIDNYSQNISLYDVDNNEILILSCLIPKKIKKCSEVIDYLYDILQKKIGVSYMKKNFYFILQKKKEFAYQLITDKNNDLKIYETRTKDIEYRLQPFLDEEIYKFLNFDYKKVFISFSEFSFGQIAPMIKFFKLNQNFLEIKEELKNCISKNKYYEDIIKEKGKLDIRIYKAVKYEGKIYRNIKELIRDEETIDIIIKDSLGACNLFVLFV